MLLNSTGPIPGEDGSPFELGSLVVGVTLAPLETFERESQGGHEGYGCAEEAEDDDWARGKLHDGSGWAEERFTRQL